MKASISLHPSVRMLPLLGNSPTGLPVISFLILNLRTSTINFTSHMGVFTISPVSLSSEILLRRESKMPILSTFCQFRTAPRSPLRPSGILLTSRGVAG